MRIFHIPEISYFAVLRLIYQTRKIPKIVLRMRKKPCLIQKLGIFLMFIEDWFKLKKGPKILCKMATQSRMSKKQYALI
jgi:hypothetical protein